MDQRSDRLLLRRKKLASKGLGSTPGADGDAVAHHRQKHKRTALLLPATAQAGGASIPCDVLNISAGGALIRTREKTHIEGPLTLRIQDREPLKAEVVRAHGDKYGIAFQEDPKIVGALVEELLSAAPHAGERRSHPRRLVLLGASYYIGDQFIQGKVINISAGGLCVKAQPLPEPGQTVELNLGRFGTMSVRVVWADDKAMGVCFLDSESEVLDRVGHLLPSASKENTKP